MVEALSQFMGAKGDFGGVGESVAGTSWRNTGSQCYSIARYTSNSAPLL